MNVDFHFTTWKLDFLNISEYLARYGIQRDPSVTERRWQSGKKPVLCMLRLLSTIIRGVERADQESFYHGKIALAHEHNWAPVTSTSACEVARTSARRLGHPARAGVFLVFFSQPPTPQRVFIQPLKDGEFTLQTPRTEFWRFGQYLYSSNPAAKTERLSILVKIS